MILQALVKYYENLAEQGKVSRLGWCHAKVSYEINLSSEGDIIGITSRKIEDMRGKKVVWVPTNLVVPEMVTRSPPQSLQMILASITRLLAASLSGHHRLARLHAHVPERKRFRRPYLRSCAGCP